VFSSNRILALNVGASKIALAEFVMRGGKAPEMVNYGMQAFDLSAEGGEGGAGLAGTIRELMRARGIRQAPMMVALSGQAVFPRFVKLPAVARDKLMQMVQYEVEQNVPFPLNEIVWDHQFIGDDSSGEQSVMIVAAKTESVREVTDSVTAAGFEPEVVDMAPMAIYNALRYNHADLAGCTVVLDIGARSTNLIFLEDDRIYNRCISNVAGNAITQELAKSLGITPAEAEAVKCKRGFVSLGGVHQSEDEEAENISRVIRNVMTRLHAEISRSINFYRSQQGGAAPSRLILTGGTSLLPYLDQFFKEKLGVEVEYLNPFVNVPLGSRISREQVGVDAFMLSEVVGLALRRSLACPVEINLMPPELVKRKTLKKRLPFFGLAAVGVLLSLGIWTRYEYWMAEIYDVQLQKVNEALEDLRGTKMNLDKALADKNSVMQAAEAVQGLIAERDLWQRRVEAVRRCLPDGNGSMWLTEMSPLKGVDGNAEGIKLTARGWKDKMKAIEDRVRAGGDSTATAVEVLRDDLAKRAVFGETPDVKITGVKEPDVFLTEFTIEVRWSSAEETKGAAK